MLKMMRKSATSGFMKIIVFGMLMAGAVGLALTGGYGFFSGAGGDTSVARVGRTRIDASAFDAMARRAAQRQGIDTRTAYQAGLLNQLLNEQIDTILLGRAAHDLGLVIGDDVVRDRIKSLVAPYIANGASAHDTLRALLRSQNMSEGQFVEDIRNETATNLLRAALQDGTAVPADSIAGDLAEFANEKRGVTFVMFPDAAIKNYKQPDEAVLKPFYQAGIERYAVPETRSFTVALLSPASVAADQAVGDADLRKAYDDQKDSLALPERRTIDQAILPGEEQARSVAALARKGDSLKDAVKAVTGNLKAYNGVETYQRAGLDKTIADAGFTAPQGGVAGPVQTPLGWHVLVVKAITPPLVPSFDEVKDKLRASIVADKAGTALYTASTQLDDELAGGGSLDEAAKKYHLALVHVGPVTTTAPLPADINAGKDAAMIMKQAFALGQGETSPVAALSDGRYAAIRMDTIVAKTYKPFASVQADLAKLWIADQQNVLNKQKVRDALAALQKDPAGLAGLAKAEGEAVHTVTLTRLAAAPDPLLDSAKPVLFKADRNTFVTVPAKNGLAIATVTSATLPDAVKLPADQLKSIRSGLLQASQDGVLQTYLDDLRTRYKVTINDDVLRQMYAGKPDDAAPPQ